MHAALCLATLGLLAACTRARPSRRVYVANENEGSVAIIDPATLRVTSTVDLTDRTTGTAQAFMAHNVQVAPDGRTVWVTANPVSSHAHDPDAGADAGHAHGATVPDQLVVIDTATEAVVARVPIGTALHLAHVVFSHDSRWAYVTASDTNHVVEVDTERRAVTRRFELGAAHGPHGVRMCGDRLWVANLTQRGVSIVNPTTGASEDIALGSMAVQTACSPDGRYAFATLYESREVVRIDLAAPHSLRRVELPTGAQGPIQLYPTPDSTRVWVCDQGGLLGRPTSNRVFEIRVDDMTVLGSVDVGPSAHGIVIDETGAFAYVTSTGDDRLYVIDTRTRSVTANVWVGRGPNGISLLHAQGAMP